MTEKYSVVECQKCHQRIPFCDNAITVNGKEVGYLCWKCERNIMGGEDDG